MMKSVLSLLAILFIAQAAAAQNAFKATIRNEAHKQPVVGATVSVKDTAITATTDASGKVELLNIPNGEQTIEVISPGYETKEIKLTFPRAEPSEQVILLQVNNEMGEVTITSTPRLSREIDDVPTRIE